MRGSGQGRGGGVVKLTCRVERVGACARPVNSREGWMDGWRARVCFSVACGPEKQQVTARCCHPLSIFPSLALGCHVRPPSLQPRGGPVRSVSLERRGGGGSPNRSGVFVGGPLWCVPPVAIGGLTARPWRLWGPSAVASPPPHPLSPVRDCQPAGHPRRAHPHHTWRSASSCRTVGRD